MNGADVPLGWAGNPVERPDDFIGRDAFVAAVDEWWQRGTEPFFVLSGRVGTGKTTALASLAATQQAVAAAHFCDPSKLSTRRPANAAKNLGVQLFDVSGYAAALEDTGSAGKRYVGTARATEVHPGGINAGVYIRSLVINADSDEETWDRLLRQPFERLSEAGHGPFLIVIDALDEADLYDRTTLSELLVGTADLGCLRWLVSTRYPHAFTSRLPAKTYREWSLSEGEGEVETRHDLAAFLHQHLADLTSVAPSGSADLADLVDMALDRSAGNFLYGRLLVDTLRQLQRPPTTRDIEETPVGLDGVLGGYLRTIVSGDDEIGWLPAYEPVLSCLCVLQEPTDFATLQRQSGVSNAVLTRVLYRLRPLLQPSTENRQGHDAHVEPATRYSLYHAAFREFLIAQKRAGQWWCDPREGHERILASYREQTQAWQDWTALDGYGLAHLFDHAREARWSAQRLSDLVVPGHIEALARQVGSIANVRRQLQVPISVAIAEADLVPAFLWNWAASLIGRSVDELLSAQAPALLAKAGHADLLVAALANVDPDDSGLPSRRREVAQSLAAEGDMSRARSLLGLAPFAEHAALLVACSIGAVTTQPDYALELLEEARQLVDDPRHVPHITGIAELAVALAADPPYAEQGWALAADERDTQRRVARAIARYDPTTAVRLATENKFADVLAEAAGVLARSDPARAWELLAGNDFRRREWARTAAAIAMHADLPPVTPELLFGSIGHDPVLHLLVLAAMASRTELGAELHDHARDQIEILDNQSDWVIDGLGDHALLAAQDVGPMAATKQATELVVAAISRVIVAYAADLKHEDSHDSKTLGQLCGSLWTLDHEAGEDAIDRIGKGTRLVRQPSFYESLVERICPVDSAYAWTIARGSDGRMRAWAASLPESRLAEGIGLVAGVDEKYSGTRAQLAGVLATKLRRGDTDRAHELLDLVTPTTRSVVFAAERRILCAAFGDEGHADRAIGDDDTDWVVSYARARRVGDSGALLWRELRQYGAAPVDAAPAQIADVAGEVAARAHYIPVAILAHTAARLCESVDDSPARRLAASSLLDESLHPVYRPTSAHVPRWPGIGRAIEEAYSVWIAHCECADFVDGLLEFANRGDHLPDIAVPLAGVAGVRPTVQAWADRHDQRFVEVLRIVDGAREGVGPQVFGGDLDHLLGNDFEGYSYVRGALVELARDHPTDTVDMLRNPRTPNFISAFGPPSQEADEAIIDVLPAIAQTDRRGAVDLAAAMQRGTFSTMGDDALHTVAVAVATDRWDAGAQIAQSIDGDSVRRLALADLAALASKIDDTSARHAAYSTILEDKAAASPLTTHRDDLVKGMVAALTADSAPMPDIVARLTPMVFRRHTSDVPAWFDLADFACVVAKCANTEGISELIASIDQILASAWSL